MKFSPVVFVLVGFLFSVSPGCGGMVVEEGEIGQTNQAAQDSEYYQAMLADLELEFDLNLIRDEHSSAGGVPAQKCYSECVKAYDSCTTRCGTSQTCRAECLEPFMTCTSTAKWGC